MSRIFYLFDCIHAIHFVIALKSKSNNIPNTVYLEPEEGLKNEDEQTPILGSEKQKK